MPKIKEIAETLRSSKKQPSHQKIAQALKSAILNGELLAGQRLPSVRNFSEMLGVSRSTVHRSFEDLLNQGLLEARHGSATTVKSLLPDNNTITALNQCQNLSGRMASQSRQNLMTNGGNGSQHNLSSSYSSFSQLTPEARKLIGPLEREFLKLWEQLKSFHAPSFPGLNCHDEPGGNVDLRRCYADYLRRTRALTKQKEDLFFFADSQKRLEELLRLTTQSQDLVAVQANVHPLVLNTLAKANLRVDLIPVDAEGIRTEGLRNKSYRLIYVAPTHQAQTGETLACQRKQELLELALDMRCLIVEDDINSELLSGKQKLPCLHFFAPQDQVIYLAQLPEALQGIIQLAAMAVPGNLREKVESSSQKNSTKLPWLEQKVLTEIIERGSLDKYCSQKRQELALFQNKLTAPAAVSVLTRNDHLQLLASELEILCNHNNTLNLV